MRVTGFLSQFAVTENGRLTVVNGCVDSIPALLPFTLALVCRVEWDETNLPHSARVVLVDAAGTPFRPQPMMPPVEVTVPFEVGRPAGVPRGVTFTVPMALNFAGLPMPPGRYEFRTSVDDQTDPNWNVSFQVIAAGTPSIQGPEQNG